MLQGRRTQAIERTATPALMAGAFGDRATSFTGEPFPLIN